MAVSRESSSEVRSGESAGRFGPPTPPGRSVRPATIASFWVRVSKADSCRERPCSLRESSWVADLKRLFSARVCSYRLSRRVELKKAQPNVTAQARMETETAAATARKRVETVNWRNRALACGTKMIVLYFLTELPFP